LNKIRLMKYTDLSFLSKMVTIAGWNQIENDWKRYMDFGPNGCFIAESLGQPVGTATTVAYENKIGWIGMVIVDPNARGQGMGTMLLKRCIDYLSPIVKTIKLDATPMGEPVYTKLGFRKEYKINRMESVAKVFQNSGVPITQIRNLDKILDYDKKALKISREQILLKLFKEYPEYFTSMEKDGHVSGYAMANAGRIQWHIGPVVANSAAQFNLLLSSLLAKLAGKKVYIDVPQCADNRFEILNKFGFKKNRYYTRMYLGENRTHEDLDKIFATARAEKG
jgi:GNAT superfamily N-acetyltransferase